jgi:hypothetical protein
MGVMEAFILLTTMLGPGCKFARRWVQYVIITFSQSTTLYVPFFKRSNASYSEFLALDNQFTGQVF